MKHINMKKLWKYSLFASCWFLSVNCGTLSERSSQLQSGPTDWFVQDSTVTYQNSSFLENCPYNIDRFDDYIYECGDHFWGNNYARAKAGKWGQAHFDSVQADVTGNGRGTGPIFKNDSNNGHHQFIDSAFAIGILKTESDLQKYSLQNPGKKIRVRAVLDFSAEGYNSTAQFGRDLGYGVYGVSASIILGGCYGTQEASGSKTRYFTVNSQNMKPYTIESTWDVDPKRCPNDMSITVKIHGKKVQFLKTYWQVMDRF